MYSQREMISLNKGWFFHLGDDLPDETLFYDNSQTVKNETNIWQKANNFALSKACNPHIESWRTLDIPHDYVVEGEFSGQASAATGSLPRGKAWYVKRFILAEEDRGKHIRIEFDGVFRNCSLSVNGYYMGRHLSGYTSFAFDITDVCNFGQHNAVAVQVDASDNELWSYEGGGIYRGVRLVKTAPVFVGHWGTFVSTGGAEDAGLVNLAVTVRNIKYDAVHCQVVSEIRSAAGEMVTHLDPVPLDITALGENTLNLTTHIDNPQLWSPDNPYLYEMVTTIKIGDVEVDRYATSFGVRYFRFDPETGFYLNGVAMKIKGVCCHQDHAGVGVAIPPQLHQWRAARLKELGCNAIRMAHNPPDPALLEACDRLGLMVIDEIRLPGTSAEMLENLESMIRRDRNHPAVILWSLGNEEMGMHHTPIGINVFRRMQHLAHQLDPSRPTTYAMNNDWVAISDLHDEANFRFDVFGTNYRSEQNPDCYDVFHRNHPDWPLLGTETWGGMATRGLYQPDKSDLPLQMDDRWEFEWRDSRYKNIASAYGGTFTPWGYSIEDTWRDCVERPFLAGTFIWTGFDYRGETIPYDWPAVLSRYGLFDYCGFYKEVAHYIRAWWRANEPSIFIMPHWNWAGHEGELMDVWCYANCHSVELFINGISLGRQVMPQNFRLEWQVAYAPGCLEAKGYDETGLEIISTYQRTTGAPTNIHLLASSKSIQADGEAVVVVEVRVVDDEGDICPLADDFIEFTVEGPIEILGVGNGNPISHEPDKFTNKRKAFHGLCQVILKSTGAAGEARLTASGWHLKDCAIAIEAIM